MSELKSLCVYCGSRTGSNGAFTQAAETLADALVERNIRLVYGGGGIGLMGVLAERVIKKGGNVVGIIPDFLQKIEKSFDDATRKIVTESMHERKQIMFEMSDAFIVLPGGIGTLDETFEMMTWRQLKQHHKPVALLNVSKYWDPFLTLISHIVDNEFAESDIRDNVIVEDEVPALLSKLGDAVKPVPSRLHQMNRSPILSK